MALFTAISLLPAPADLHAPLETPGTDAQEGDAVAVLGVHVGLDLEDEAGELGFVGLTGRFAAGRARGRREFDHGIEQGLDTKVVNRRTEEDRRLLARQVGPGVEGVGGAAHQFDVGAQFLGLGADQLIEARVGEALDDLGSPLLGLGVEEGDSIVVEVVERRGNACPCRWARSRGTLDTEHRLDFVEEVDGFLPSRSSLLMKVRMGVSRLRQTFRSLMVWASTPFSESITMTAESPPSGCGRYPRRSPRGRGVGRLTMHSR